MINWPGAFGMRWTPIGWYGHPQVHFRKFLGRMQIWLDLACSINMESHPMFLTCLHVIARALVQARVHVKLVSAQPPEFMSIANMFHQVRRYNW